MRFEPLIPPWLLIPYCTVAVAASVWLIWRVRRKGQSLLILWGRRAALLLLLAILALGPSVPGGTSSPGVSNLDVIFAVDVTPSMGALDYDGTGQRLDGVKKDLLALAGQLQGAHLEIITFDSEANVVLPFTTYATAFSEAVAGLTPDISGYSQGTSIDKPYDLIGQELAKSKLANPQRYRLVFYLGDGEQTVSAPVQSFAPLAPYENGGAVLGYGTTTGAKMLNYTDPGLAPTSYIQTLNPTTQQLEPAVSKMDPLTLETMASQLKVPFQYRNLGGSLKSTLQASQTPLLIDKSQHIVRYLNLYWLFAIPLAGILFWEWRALIIKLNGLRNRRGGRHA